MGLAFVYGDRADIFQIKLPSEMNAVIRMQATATVVQYLLGFQPGPKDSFKEFRAGSSHCVIEGAAHGAGYGQVPLAENRTIATAMAMTVGLPVAILPPSEIKMRIFGKGNMRAREFWPFLQIKDEVDKVLRDDAAAALSCAFLAYVLKRQEALLG